MNDPEVLQAIHGHLGRGGGLNLFLDYDGTLMPIGGGPSELRSEPALVDLLRGLARCPATPTTVLSARPLAALNVLFPIPELTLAGVYGLEIQINGEHLSRAAPLPQVRPVLEHLKSRWEQMIAGRAGCWVEDKGLAVALHADGAAPAESARLMQAARSDAAGWLAAKDFVMRGGGNYLEVAPGAADKGQAVDWLLRHTPRPDLLPVCFGDDDNDDQAFAVVQRRGGLTIGVGQRCALPHALARVELPDRVRQVLHGILAEAERAQRVS